MEAATESTLLITKNQVVSLLSNEEIIEAIEGVFNLVFDSTGMALQDVATSVIVYEKEKALKQFSIAQEWRYRMSRHP